MATFDKILERRKEVSDKISTQVRTLSLSFLAVVWLFLVPSKEGPPVFPFPLDKDLLLNAGLLAVLAMIVDYLHYAFAYLAAHDLITTTTKETDDKGVVTEETDYKYDDKSKKYLAIKVAFWTKQALVALSFALLVLAFKRALFG